MKGNLSTLAEKAALAVAKNADNYSEEQIRSIPNDDQMRVSILDKLMTYDSLKKFLDAFDLSSDVEPWEINSEIVRRRWLSDSPFGSDNFRLQSKRVKCAHRVCLTDYGYICATTTGRIIAYEADQVKPKILGSYKTSRVTHLFYHKERLFVVFLNWKIRMWIRTGTTWEISVIYEDAVALRGWINCVMADDGVMAYTDGHALEMYKLKTHTAGKIYSTMLNMTISNLSLCKNFMVYTSIDIGGATIFHILNRSNGKLQNWILHFLDPKCISIVTTDDYLFAYLGLADGDVASLRFPLRNGLVREFSKLERDGHFRVMSVKATKERVACSYSDGTIKVFRHDRTLIREIDVSSLRTENHRPKKKRRKRERGASLVVVNENRMDLDMDESRLLCLDGPSHRVYCWDFSE